APLGPHHLHRPGNGDVTHTLQPAGVDPLGHHSAVRAARRVGRLDHYPAPALGPVAGLDDAVGGQVEDRARSSTLRARRLVHRLVVLCLVDVSTTPITAGPRALTHLRRAGHFHHEPRRAGKVVGNSHYRCSCCSARLGLSTSPFSLVTGAFGSHDPPATTTRPADPG